MRLDPFKLERYLARYEFTAPHQLSCSDCDGLGLGELLELADDESKALWESLALGYTEAPGHPLLRAEIAGLYSGIGADDVLVGAPEELIFLAVNSMARNGDHVVCTFPAYQSLYQVAVGMHCEVTYWEADEKQGWRFEPARLAEMIRPSTRLIVVNFPHNPTGALPTRDDFDAVVEIARRHKLTLLCDEMYRLLEHDEAARLPAVAEVYERGVSLSGMSKVFGLAGARIGWVASRDARLLKRMLTLKDYTTICNSAPSEILSLMALRARQPIVERHIARIRRNLATLNGFMGRYPNLFAWHPPVAGTVCLPRVVPETLRAEALCDAAVKEAGVVLVPASVFDYGDRHVRFGLGREAFPEALAAFDAFLASKIAGAAAPAAPAATSGPAGVEPAVAEPAVSEPARVEPAVVEPAVSEPAGVEPAVVGPAVTEPAVTEPAVVGPAVTEPAVAAPAADVAPAPPAPALAEADDPLSEFAIEISPSTAAPATDDLSAVAPEAASAVSSEPPTPGEEPRPADEASPAADLAYFPASARDAHPERDVTTTGGEPVRGGDAGEGGATPGGPAPPGTEEPAHEPDSPQLPEGIVRGQGLPLDFFDEPSTPAGPDGMDLSAPPVEDLESAGRSDGPDAAPDPVEVEVEVEVVTPGDIAPEAVFAAPRSPDPDDAPAPEAPLSERREGESAAPGTPGPAEDSWDETEPPPGSWGTIPPPDQTPGT